MGIKLDKDSLAAEQNNYSTKIAYDYIAYELDGWKLLNILLSNFKSTVCLFCATNIVQNRGKEKWSCKGYGITFHGTVSWKFDNDFAQNVVIFGVFFIVLWW